MTDTTGEKRRGPSWSVESEVLRLLPSEFVAVYTELADAVVGRGDVVRAAPNPRASARYSVERTRSDGVDVVGSAPSRGKMDGSIPVVNERAMHTKSWVDRRLRKLTRELRTRLTPDGDNEPIRKCAGRCGRFGESRWNYCPQCGGPMENVNREGD